MDFLHSEFDLDAGDEVVVDLDAKANVLLMDPANFGAYQRGGSYRYHGGHAEKTPATVVAPHGGRWHLVVDLGGYPGRVSASARVRKTDPVAGA